MLRLLGLLLFAVAAIANAAAPRELIEESQARSLARDPYWLALIHYVDGASEITSPQFFLSPSGRRDAQAELNATLEGIFAQPGAVPDQHVQCRFVARYRWLARQLSLSRFSPPRVECPSYRTYAANGRIQSISVVYATGYLSNPASFYGHILIKFNSNAATPANELLEQTLNFGAAVPRAENPVVYIAKGLFGGYDGAFSNLQFFSVNHAYAENELRDLWEYVLALSQDEVDQLVAHSWELLGQNFDYYFLKENCAFRMAQLLELVVDRELLPSLPWAIPASLFDRLSAIERNGKPLVQKVRRIPSRQRVFRERYSELSARQQSAAVEIVEHDADFSRALYADLGAAEKIGVVDMLLDYYEYRVVSDRKDADLPKSKQKALLERLRLPARKADQTEGLSRGATGPPHEGPLPFLLGAGALHNSRRGSGLAMRIRPGSYDALALDAGRIPNSTLAVFDATVVALDDRLTLRRLDFFNVQNLNVDATPLPFDGGMAWRVRGAYEAQDLACEHCGVAKLEGGIGTALALSRATVGFVMLDGQVQSRHANSGWLAVAPTAGMIGSPIPGWKISLSLGHRIYPTGERASENVLRWENRLGGQRNWDLRLSYEQHAAREVLALLSLYW